MQIELIEEPITRKRLFEIAQNQFGNLVKAVVDIEKGIFAIGGDLHADEETFLIDHGSHQEHLWGINLYPAKTGEDFIEFDSMINVRPSQDNNSRSVESSAIQETIRTIIARLVVA